MIPNIRFHRISGHIIRQTQLGIERIGHSVGQGFGTEDKLHQIVLLVVQTNHQHSVMPGGNIVFNRCLHNQLRSRCQSGCRLTIGQVEADISRFVRIRHHILDC
ncbi:hypothetical protein D3C76_1669370 [compost metagenome]